VKRFRRWIFNGVAATSLILSVAILWGWLRQRDEQYGVALASQTCSINAESSPTGVHLSVVTGLPDPSAKLISWWGDTWGVQTEWENGKPVPYQNVWHPPRHRLFAFQWEKRVFENGDTAWRIVIPYDVAVAATIAFPIWWLIRWRRGTAAANPVEKVI
jgi:hypothetical protein